VFNYSITELYNLSPAPETLAGHLWRYRVIISRDGILEDYRTIERSIHQRVILLKSHSVYYDWKAEGATTTFT
jgi:hypothetical protein